MHDLENNDTDVQSDDSLPSFTENSEVSIETVESSDEDVKDSKNLVFIIFVMFGFGSLLPWNMFLNISFDYYTMFKLRESSGNSTTYSKNFQNSMTVAAQVPSFLFSFASVFSAAKGDLTCRMRICLIVVQLMVIVTMTFIYIDTEKWITVFFGITIATIIALNAANGLFQNSMFGLVSPFPFKYTNAIIIGQNFCGIAVTILSMSTKAISNDVQMRAILFFSISSVVIITCFVLLSFIRKLRFYEQYGVFEVMINTERSEKVVESDKRERLRNAFYGSKKQFFNIFFLFFVTLAIFPNVCMYVRDDENVMDEKYFMDIATFLNFNLFAFLGSLLANWIQFPGPRTIWIPVMARFWFFFYFPMANYQPMDHKRKYQVVFESTWLFIVNVSVFAFSSGYLSSLIMMYAPRPHRDPKVQRTAGMVASCFLITGILIGLIFSWNIRMFITGVK